MCPASARPWFPVSARVVVCQSPREALLHNSRSVVKFCDILSIHCFQIARVVLVFCPVLEVFVHTSHMMSHRTRCRALDLSLWLRVSLILRIKNTSHQRASQVSSSGSVLSPPLRCVLLSVVFPPLPVVFSLSRCVLPSPTVVFSPLSVVFPVGVSDL